MRRALVCLLALSLALPGLGQERPSIAVVSYPLAYFAERLAGGGAEVVFPVPADRDPAFWRPGIADITAIQSADLIALNGAGFAGWTARASLPRARLVDTGAALKDRFIATETVTHSHGADGEHSHTGTASFLWLDFALAAAQAEALAGAMASRIPALAPVVERNRAALLADLADLDALAGGTAAAMGSTVAIASHPRYQYFARAYGLRIEAVDWEAGAMPDAEAWAGLEALVAETGATLFLWEAAPPAAALAEMEARGLSSVVFPPLANRPAEGDFMSAMGESLRALKRAAVGE